MIEFCSLQVQAMTSNRESHEMSRENRKFADKVLWTGREGRGAAKIKEINIPCKNSKLSKTLMDGLEGEENVINA